VHRSEPGTRHSARDAGVDSGFMMAQVTAASLASECKVYRIRRASTQFRRTATRKTWSLTMAAA
jgi:histidine ammonia-lyase